MHCVQDQIPPPKRSNLCQQTHHHQAIDASGHSVPVDAAHLRVNTGLQLLHVQPVDGRKQLHGACNLSSMSQCFIGAPLNGAVDDDDMHMLCASMQHRQHAR